MALRIYFFVFFSAGYEGGDTRARKVGDGFTAPRNATIDAGEGCPARHAVGRCRRMMQPSGLDAPRGCADDWMAYAAIMRLAILATVARLQPVTS
jgi:hypothetical protein